MEMLSAVAVDAPGLHPAPGLSRLSDELLARYAGRGSARALEAVYRRYHQPLYQYCRSILRHEPDAQDALQSTFAKALAALQAGQRSAPLRPWLFRIAHNEAISIIRSRRREEPSEAVGELAGTAASAEEAADGREQFSTLMQDLGELPDKQRAALLQRELSGLSHEDIAVALGTSTGAAKQLIFEARQALAELAEGRAMECTEVRRRISDGDRRVLRGRRISSHLRGCAGCAEFAAAIPARRAELRAMVPLLAPVAAGELFARALRMAGGHGSAGAAAAPATGVAGAAAGAAAKLAGGGLIWKAIAGGVILAGAAVGVTRLHHTHHPAVPAHQPAGLRRAAGARHTSAAIRGRTGAGQRAPAGRGATRGPGAGHRASHAAIGFPAVPGRRHGSAPVVAGRPQVANSTPVSSLVQRSHGSGVGHGVSATHGSGVSHSHAGGSGHARSTHSRSSGSGGSSTSTGRGHGRAVGHSRSTGSSSTTSGSGSSGAGSHGRKSGTLPGLGHSH